MPPFSLVDFEAQAYRGDREAAAAALLRLVQQIDLGYGHWNCVEPGSVARNIGDTAQHTLARLVAALCCLLGDPAFELSPSGFLQMVAGQRWLAALFAATSLGNADHVLATLRCADGADAPLRVPVARLGCFCLLYFADSECPLDLDALWAHDRQMAAALALALLSPRFLGTPAAHGKRETLLGWLPARLAQLDSLDGLPRGILHDAYMHCSYASRPDKHEIKRQLNRLVRIDNLARGWGDIEVAEPETEPGSEPGRPRLLVVLEWFSGSHSVYRTHSASMRGLRERFHVLGLGTPAAVDASGRAVFDEFIALEGTLADMVGTVRSTVLRLAPAAVYYPSIGMFPLTIHLANMRLAPVQMTALGHGASSMCACIDWFAVEEDFIGDPATFSERLLRLPPDAMPHVPSASFRRLEPRLCDRPEVVRIAVAATPMKLNPALLAACRAITARARGAVHFVFVCGLTHGLVEMQLRRFVGMELGNATVHASQPYAGYMALLNTCDMFIDPFPYGNMNGIVDMALLGLAGVCRCGPQVHEQIDAGMFRRLGLPGWLVASTDEAYVAAAVRLADGHEERLALRRDMLRRDAVQAIFRGDAGQLASRLHDIVERARSVEA